MRRVSLQFVALALTTAIGAQEPRQSSFTLQQVKSYPFPNELTAAATGARLAWALDEQGRRNLWVAAAPAFMPRRITSYLDDDGQELTSVSVSADGRWVVYVRGGDHSANWDDALPVNPTGQLTPAPTQVWSVRFDCAGDTACAPHLLGEGDLPAVSPRSDVVAFVKDHQVWLAPINGSRPARRALTAHGDNDQLVWSPDGSRLAFVSSRGDHAFLGIYSGDSSAVTWIAPSTSRDGSPRWSPDGKQIVFVRRPGGGGAPDSVLVQHPTPWAIWTADVATGAARLLWTSPATLRGSAPSTHGGANLHWAAGDRIVFLSYMDGWPHLYSIASSGGEPVLLTPGNFMVEHVTMSADGHTLVAAANTGPDRQDIDRRHVIRVRVDQPGFEVVTPGVGLEWSPVMTGDGSTLAFISATFQGPPVPAIISAGNTALRLLGADRIPADFPTASLVRPDQVVFRAPDGTEIHGQLFRPLGDATERRPAVVFVHGGPPRQMLLGWHYSDYYANAYALNQYLASRGFVVLSVNYRLGIGYGREFHHPPGAGAQGAAEYQDVKAAAEWLRGQPFVDPTRIGIYGGSYGGFLTAMALSMNSDLFAAGVDLHGVHDWTAERMRPLVATDRYERAPDTQRALQVAWESSPVSHVSTWKSPVLLIQGDDDRNVRFSQTVDLVQRLRDAGVPYEELVIPDDTHHFMRHANWVRADSAAAEFLERKLGRR